MFKPYFNTKENYHKFQEDIKKANGYCMNCNKPLTYRHIYCNNCLIAGLYYDGLEGGRVRFGSVGRNVVNYQQYLHRSIFGCNVHFKYRGLKDDRIKAVISKKSLNKATIRINRMLSCVKYELDGKTYNNNKHNREIYSKVKHVRNIQERLVYNTLLYYISYHIEDNKEFKSFAHFQTSMMHNLLINVENTHIRVNRPENFRNFNQRRKNNTVKYWHWLFKEIDDTMKPLMNEIIEAIT